MQARARDGRIPAMLRASRKKVSHEQDIVTRPMTPSRWPDLVRLFGKHGGCAGCWCMYPRLRHRDYVAGKGAANRRRLRALVAKRALHGALAYVDGVPAAWCSFVFGTLMIFVNVSPTRRTKLDRVSSSPKKLVST